MRKVHVILDHPSYTPLSTETVVMRTIKAFLNLIYNNIFKETVAVKIYVLTR